MNKLITGFKNFTSNFIASFNKWSLKKKIISIVLALVIIGFLFVKLSQLQQPPPYTTDKAAKANIIEYVTETGNIAPAGALNVYSPSNGIVTNIYVANGDAVSANQKLFDVESSATQQETQAAYANYLAAVSTLNAAQSSQDTLRADMYGKWKTFRDMATNSTYENSDKSPNTDNRKAAEFQIAQDEWNAAEKKYKDQQTAIGQAQAAVSSTWLLYQATQNSTVTAPSDGIVTNLSVTNDSPVSINTAVSPQTPALVITKGSTNEVVVPLSETDIAKVHPGQEVKISVDSVNNRTYKGVVKRVDSLGEKVQGVITYNVYIALLDADENLRAGMSVDAEITTKKLTNVISVPNSAVKPYQGGRAVRVPGSKKGEVKYLPVVVGIKGLQRTQILKGLEEGQTIIVTLANEQIKRPGLFGR